MARKLALAPETVALQSTADLALGRLSGAGRILPNTELLLAPYALQESLDSSRIEGTQATLSDVFAATATGDADRVDVQEVLNYRAAMDHGLTSGLPLSKRLLQEMHAILLTGVRGQEKTPGEFRRSQNWIGSVDNTIDNARFVPPPVPYMDEALNDWEDYHHADIALPLLIRCGLLHCQFETIHPFLDGNGRLGRLFITLFFVEKGPLPAPLLYVSSYFEATKQEYYDRLQAVREHGDMTGWLVELLPARRRAAGRGRHLQDRAADGHTGELPATRPGGYSRPGDRGSRPRPGESDPDRPRLVSRRLGVSGQSGLNILRQIENTGILRPAAPGADGRYRWVCDEILSTVYNGG